MRGVVEARADDRVTLYTGNDDHILLDLVTPFTVMRAGTPVSVGVKGGLLGHWSVWTQARRRAASEMPPCCGFGTNPGRAFGVAIPRSLTATAPFLMWPTTSADVLQVATRCSGARDYSRASGASIRRKGLVRGRAEEIDRVYEAYPKLNDDAFVRTNLHRWL